MSFAFAGTVGVNPGHPGIDIEAQDNTPIRAWADGIISPMQSSGHYDFETFSMFHENNYDSYYTGNMKNSQIKEKTRVKAGDIIAYYDGDASIHYGLQQKEPDLSICPVDFFTEEAKSEIEELFSKATYKDQEKYPLLCNPCPEGGCR